MSHSRLLWWRTSVAGLVVLFLLAGCGDEGGDAGSGAQSDSGASGELVVFAAASLTESFRRIEQVFEADPDVIVRFNFAGSSSLSQQIIRGAPADVFASANPQQMQRAMEAGEIAGEPTTFVQNRLQIAVPPGNPAGVQGLAAFGKEELNIALCAQQVPCGAAAQKALQIAGVAPKPDTLEQDVKAVLTKVRLGEVDAGLVYQTDVVAAGDAVDGISFEEASQAVNDYKIAVVQDAGNGDAARAFVDFVLSGQGQAILADFGFDTKTP